MVCGELLLKRGGLEVSLSVATGLFATLEQPGQWGLGGQAIDHDPNAERLLGIGLLGEGHALPEFLGGLPFPLDQEAGEARLLTEGNSPVQFGAIHRTLGSGRIDGGEAGLCRRAGRCGGREPGATPPTWRGRGNRRGLGPLCGAARCGK